MKTVTELLPKNPNQNALPERSASTGNHSESAQDRADFMSRVWTELRHKGLVHDSHGSDRFRSFCRDTLDLSRDEIKRGLDRCKDFRGFFTPGEFRSLCRSIDHSALGIPTPEAAFDEACRNAHSLAGATWSHAAVYHAGADVGWYRLRHAAYQGSEKHEFRNAYHVRIQQLQAGVLPEIPQHELLPDGIRRKASSETRAKHLNMLYGMLA